jgi:hypothetical protein
MAKTLEDFLKEKAAELKVNYDNVPKWVIKAANEYIEQHVPKEPTAREKAIELASHYLCDGDLTTEQMVEAIANNEDEDDLIDNVDGVIVWEKVEYEFTCEQFLDDIGWEY